MITKNWVDTFVTGDCSTQTEIPEKYGWCRFTHPWHADSTNLLDIGNLDLKHGVESGLTDTIKFYTFRLLFVLVPMAVAMIVLKICKKVPTKTISKRKL